MTFLIPQIHERSLGLRTGINLKIKFRIDGIIHGFTFKDHEYLCNTIGKTSSFSTTIDATETIRRKNQTISIDEKMKNEIFQEIQITMRVNYGNRKGQHYKQYENSFTTTLLPIGLEWN